MLQDSPKPKYPSVLESSGIAGEVQAQFVVNTDGRADMSEFKVLKSTNELFTQAVKNVLPRMHFSPAMIGGKPGDPDVEPDGDPLCAGACGAPAADPLPPFCA
ncbi:MAG: energy transducer TonB [Paraburkholderia graminis]|uniref:energy transducer TonB n=1 Tax=Paraburkholderia graminis TaxID=60548 RepID=UPI003899D78E